MSKHLKPLCALSLLWFVQALHYAMSATNQVTKNDSPAVYVSDYGQVEQGSFFLEAAGKKGYLLSPLVQTKVDIKVTGLVARAKVTQIFINTHQQWVNGIYVFPLPENAAVDHLTMQIGERRIVGEIQPKQKAKAIYEEAKLQGKKASLLVQQRPNLFTNSVANIGPNEQIEVTIEYQQAIRYDNGEFSLRFPTTVTPRYLPLKAEGEDNLAISQNGWGITQPFFLETHSQEQAITHKVAMSIKLNIGFELADIVSEHHPILQSTSEVGHYSVTLKNEMIANQDFVLRWRPMPDKHPKAAHFVQQTDDGYYGMIMLMPPETESASAALPREAIFVIDTSGSMEGSSLQQAKQALLLAIENLAVTDTFNLIQFNSSADKIWRNAQQASEENKRAAKRYVRGLSANGGTQILSALRLALGNQPTANEHIRQVVFMTDGAVGNETELFTYIDSHIGGSRLFTVGIGSAPNSFFMVEAARMGKGTHTHIGSIDTVGKQMQALFEKLTHPVLADLTLDLDDVSEVYPQRLPDLYKGEPLMVSYHTRSPVEQLRVSGTLKHQYWQKSLTLNHSSEQHGLDVLWARRKIAQLTRNKVKGHDRIHIDKQIEEVAMRHHLVSAMTSLVAVDVTPTALDLSIDSQVMNMAAKRVAARALPQTATAASLHFVLAIMLIAMAFLTKRLALRIN